MAWRIRVWWRRLKEIVAHAGRLIFMHQGPLSWICVMSALEIERRDYSTVCRVQRFQKCLSAPRSWTQPRFKTDPPEREAGCECGGPASTLITKRASDTRPSVRTAAEVFIYMKRLSTYIIRIITSERILQKEITAKDTSYNFFWFQKALSPSPSKVWFHLLPRARWCIRIKRRDLFTIYRSINIIPPCFQKGKSGHPVEPTSPFLTN